MPAIIRYSVDFNNIEMFLMFVTWAGFFFDAHDEESDVLLLPDPSQEDDLWPSSGATYSGVFAPPAER